MSEYYGTPAASSDFLAHYGVKGMRWGVRKAIDKGNSRSLERHYQRASKKLAKLNARADVAKQKELSDKWNKAAKGSAIAGHIGLGVAVSGTGAHHLLSNVGIKKIKALDDTNVKRIHDINMKNKSDAAKYFGNVHRPQIRDYVKDIKNDEDAKRFKDFVTQDINIRAEDANAAAQHKQLLKNNYKGQEIADTARSVGLGIALGGYGYATGAKIKAHQAYKRTTAEGHKKAVAERNAWRNQMQDVFKGTKYAGLPALSPKKRKRR